MEQNIEDLKQQIEALQQENETLRQQLRQQEKMASLGLLSAGIAHEIQNPLNFVINFSKMSSKLIEDLGEVLEDCADNIEGEDAEDIEDISLDLKENMQKIMEHGERAISIIRNILLQSRGKEGEFLPTDVATVVHEYVWLSYHAMRAKDKSFNISIHEEYQEALPKFMLITQDVCRAVLNLMNNACYAVRERAMNCEDSSYVPTITVKVSLDVDGKLIIIVADNGTGMTDEVRKKLFHSVFTTKPVGQGTGLGLNITHQIIVVEHGGELLVDSTYGEGTTFTIILPAKKV